NHCITMRHDLPPRYRGSRCNLYAPAGAATPATGAAAPAGDRTGRGRQPLAGWPQPIVPAGGRPLRAAALTGGHPLRAAALRAVTPCRGPGRSRPPLVETTIPFGLLRLAEQLMPYSTPANALARLRLFANTVPTTPFKI
ncbi:hypothetical protein BHE74_00046346, partial [Ensete ventricosum]